MVTLVRMVVWDEIQEAVWSQNGTYLSHFYRALHIRPCALCSHDRHVHSQILPFEPCLDCDCIGWTVISRPDPVMMTRW